MIIKQTWYDVLHDDGKAAAAVLLYDVWPQLQIMRFLGFCVGWLELLSCWESTIRIGIKRLSNSNYFTILLVILVILSSLE